MTKDEMQSSINSIMFSGADFGIEMFVCLRDYEGQIPGASPRDCGNYLALNLPMAKYLARNYLEHTLAGIGPERLHYPD